MPPKPAPTTITSYSVASGSTVVMVSKNEPGRHNGSTGRGTAVAGLDNAVRFERVGESGRRRSPLVECARELAVREVLVHPELPVGVESLGGEHRAQELVAVDPHRGPGHALPQQAVLGCPHDEVSGRLDHATLEEHLDATLLAVLHTVEDAHEIADHAGFVLDGQRGRVLHVETADVARDGVHPTRAPEP